MSSTFYHKIEAEVKIVSAEWQISISSETTVNPLYQSTRLVKISILDHLELYALTMHTLFLSMHIFYKHGLQMTNSVSSCFL